MKVEVYATLECGSTSPTTRLPRALIGRWRGGETCEELAADYGIPVEQVWWGIELEAWREAAADLPPVRREKLLTAVDQKLGGFRRFKLLGRDGDVFSTAQEQGR